MRHMPYLVALPSLALWAGLACTGGDKPQPGPEGPTAVPGVPPVAAQPVSDRLVVLLLPGMDPDLAERWRGDLPTIERLAPGRKLSRLASDAPYDPVHAAAQLATGTAQGRSSAIGGPGFQPGTMSWTAARFDAQDYALPTFWERAARGGVPTRALWVPGPTPADPPDNLWIMPESSPSPLPTGPVVVLVGAADPPATAGLGPVVRAEGEGPWSLEVPLADQVSWALTLSQPRPDAYRVDVGGVRIDIGIDELSLPIAIPLPESAGGGFVMTRVSAVQRGDGVAISLIGAGRVPGVGGAVTTPGAYAEEWRRYHGEPDTTGGAAGLMSAFEAGLLAPRLMPAVIEEQLRERGHILVEELGRRDARLFVASLPEAGLAGQAFLGFADPNHPAWSAEQAAIYGGTTKTLYVKLDEVLGKVRSALQPGDRLVVVSDHGVDTARYLVDLNQALAGAGAMNLGRTTLPATVGQGLPWSRVSAWSAGAGMVWVHSTSRFADGTTSGRAEEKLRASIESSLRRLKHEGRPVVSDIVDGDEAFAGVPEAERPDYLVVLSEGYEIAPTSYYGTVGQDVVTVNKGPVTGGRGASAEDVRGFFLTSFGATPADMHAADVAPTVLTMLGVPGAEQLDGMVWSIGVPASEDETAPDPAAP